MVLKTISPGCGVWTSPMLFYTFKFSVDVKCLTINIQLLVGETPLAVLSYILLIETISPCLSVCKPKLSISY